LDTACYLAFLQEESIASKGRDVKRSEGTYSSRPFSKGSMSLPRPPVQAKRDFGMDEKSLGRGQKPQSIEDKMAAWTIYRMAKGLCRKCGENGIRVTLVHLLFS
jgi:hypothetical protein